MRFAELSDVLRALESNIGRRFADTESLSDSLFVGNGGGFGIPTVLRNAVTELISERCPDSSWEPSAPSPLSREVIGHLGAYVYALRDPRDNAVFYVGKGRGNRVYSHVWAALGSLNAFDTGDGEGEQDVPEITSAKLTRIHDIHGSGHEVEHWIVRHAITSAHTDDLAALAVEQAMIDVLRLGESSLDTPVLTNIAGGHTASQHRMTTVEELARRYAAPPIPPLPYPCIVVSVNGTADPLCSPDEIYEMSRRYWPAGQVRNLTDLPAIVFGAGIVRAVYRIKSWTQVDMRGRTPLYEFTGAIDPDLNSAYVGRRIVPADASRNAWPQNGWVRLTD